MISVFEDFDNSFFECHGSCQADGQAAGCHSYCVSLVPEEFRQALILATSYHYKPLLTQDVLRIQRLVTQCSQFIREQYDRLPLELCLQVAQYCLADSKFAADFSISLARNLLRTPFSGRVNITLPVWARYITFEGVKYIAYLTNKRPEEDCQDISRICEPGLDRLFFIAQDHLGVREIISSRNVECIPERQGLWWRTIRISDRDPYLQYRTDVSRISLFKRYS